MSARTTVSAAGIICCLLLLPVGKVSAARMVSISADKLSLKGNENLRLTASMSGFADAEPLFVKGVFYADGSTNYFGYTKNGDVWIKSGDATTGQRQVKIGEWDGGLDIMPDFSDSGFKGEGEYRVKLGFYYTTSGGNLSSVNWSSNAVSVIVNEPDPTITPVPTAAPVPTATPSPRASTAVPTDRPTETPSPLSVPTAAGSVSDRPVSTISGYGRYDIDSDEDESVADDETRASVSGISVSADDRVSESFRLAKVRGIALAAASLGCMCISAASYIAIRQRSREEKNDGI